MLKDFLSNILKSDKDISSATIAYLANLENTAKINKSIALDIVNEFKAQRSKLKMIASENYSSLNTQLTMGNLLTDKYAEGYVNHRYYAGCDNIDSLEGNACKTACELFGAEHAYVQAHSGADANMVAYAAILNARIQKKFLEEVDKKTLDTLTDEEWKNLRNKLGNQKLLGLSYYAGGHLTHGYKYNISSRIFEAHSYGVDSETGLLDYDQIRQQAKEVKPLILLAGYSSYPRKVNFRIMREIADEIGAVFMVDMAHFAGLVAGKVLIGDFNPVAHAHIVTSTTHKTLRGPRGGLILCTKEFAPWIDQGCPLVLGGPLAHCIAAKAVAFTEANTPEFQTYAQQIVKNSEALAEELLGLGVEVLTGGSENHIVLLDVRNFSITGKQAEGALTACNITANRNSIPNDPNGAWYTSGVRLGTSALTTLGMKEGDMREIAQVIYSIFSNTTASVIQKGANAGKNSKVKFELLQSVIDEAQNLVKGKCEAYLLYPEIDLELIENFVNSL